MRRIHHQQRELVCQQIVDRTSGDAGAFHGHMGARKLPEPIAEREDLGRGGAKGAGFLVDIHGPLDPKS